MSAVHRRILPASEPRCHPSPDCPLQDSCSRFTSPLPQGIGATLGNYRGKVVAGPIVNFCAMFVNQMVSDGELAAAAKKPVKPPLGAK